MNVFLVWDDCHQKNPPPATATTAISASTMVQAPRALRGGTAPTELRGPFRLCFLAGSGFRHFGFCSAVARTLYAPHSKVRKSRLCHDVVIPRRAARRAELDGEVGERQFS